jgi:hypothetical protein
MFTSDGLRWQKPNGFYAARFVTAPKINGAFCGNCGDAIVFGRPHGCLNDNLASARAEIERLTKALGEERAEREAEHIAAPPPRCSICGKETTCGCRETIGRAFAFLCSLAPHFNAPALSQQGKREREEFNALVGELKKALRPQANAADASTRSFEPTLPWGLTTKTLGDFYAKISKLYNWEYPNGGGK